ncbi:MAG: hypothetical protein IKO72_09480, partial [Kiritimatiellae bacterium]|nr:hypothetical protein [Kiritimatiellia bacterium]
MKQKIVAMMAALAVPFAASATTCITDVMVVGGSSSSVTNSYAEQGWKVIPQDLNAGAKGDYIYLLYKSADSAIVSNGFITGFYIKTGKDGVTNELTQAGRAYSLAPCAGSEAFVEGQGDLNSKTVKQGDVIHLYYTKSALPDNRVVTGITINSDQSGAVGKNGGTTGYDLNSGAGGDFIYMHVTTAALPYAPEVPYLDPTDHANPEKVRHGYTFITSQTELSSGWYVVAGAVAIGSCIHVSGDVNLILTDGAELAANGGVNVEGENSLTIWAQSTNTVAGKLLARGEERQAGIGGGKSRAGGEVTVNGGTVEAHGGTYATGIGGGYQGAGGTVTINGGTVTATGGYWGAGIGGGYRGADGTMTVNGGTVTAYGGASGAGIGGGFYGSGGTVTVNGGKVEVHSDDFGAGIGGGELGNGGEVTVNGGTVEAHGGYWGAGIGGGKHGAGGVVTINGGTVEVHGGYGAGIGGGGGKDGTNHGSLSILLGMAVYDADTSETPVAFGEREAVCRSSWAKVTPCPYADEARGLCPYCGFGSLVAGEYFKATLAEMGYDVPTNGTAYSVKAYGLPAGLKLMSNKAVTKKVKVKGKWKKVVVKPAKSEWWIEGVPTAALDYETNPPYLAITVGGKTELVPFYLEVFAQDVKELGTFPVGTAWNAESPLYLPGVTNGWTVSGLPSGLKYTSKLVTKANKKGKKVVSVTTNALPYSVYGKTTKAGLFTITAKKKKGAYYETMKYRMLVTPKAPDAAVFGDDLTNITTMAYVPVEWDLTGENGRARSPSGPQSGTDGEQSNVDGGRLGEAALPSVAAV